MSVIDVVAEFASRESLPVQVDEVADFLKSKWVKDEFYFFETDIDPGILRGFITAWDYPRDDSGHSTATVADIHYSKNDTLDWQRLVSDRLRRDGRRLRQERDRHRSLMGEAAHDLRDRAAVHTEVMGRLALAPAEFENGIEDVAGGEIVAGKFGHSRSLTPFRRIEGDRLERDDQKCDSQLVGLSLLVAVQAG